MPNTPRIYGTPDNDHQADRSIPATGFRGEAKALSGEGHKREALVEDDHPVIVEEMSGVAAAEAAGLDPHSDNN